MLNIKGPVADMGIIVCRFQTPYLTPGQCELIETVKARHPKFAIVIGVANVIPSRNNPLDYGTRYHMILDKYPKTQIYFIRDTASDDAWSEHFDKLTRLLYPHEKIVLYGSRDSFIKHYTGKFPTVELDDAISESGTDARNKAFHEIKDTEDFRRGVCYATANQYKRVVPTVDVAILKQSTDEFLVGRKHNETKWRFIGGFAEGRFEDDARREVYEETGAEIGKLISLGSCPIDDWRYRGTGDKIVTNFYIGHYITSPTKAADDIEEITWLLPKQMTKDRFVETHWPLLDILHEYLGTNFNINPLDDYDGYKL